MEVLENQWFWLVICNLYLFLINSVSKYLC